MIATIKRKIDGNCYCSNCRMGQRELRPFCFYCGAAFSNYEEVQVEIFKEAEDECE